MSDYELATAEDLFEDFLDCEFGYVQDVIVEVADSYVDIYTLDLFKSLPLLYERYAWEEASSAMDLPDDLVKAIQYVQHYYYERLIYDNFDSLKYEYVKKQTSEYIKEKSYEVLLESQTIDEIVEDLVLDLKLSEHDKLEDWIDDIQYLLDYMYSEFNGSES